MKTALLDGNVYDILARDQAFQKCIINLVRKKELRILVTRTVAQELSNSPFRGVPVFIPTEYSGNTVSRVGILRYGDRLGPGNVYYAHLGESKKTDDAHIADAASRMADWLVSGDVRLKSRFKRFSPRGSAISYEEFKLEVQLLTVNSSGGTQNDA